MRLTAIVPATVPAATLPRCLVALEHAGADEVLVADTPAGATPAHARNVAVQRATGDVLVFANTYRRGLSHVGIYIGDGQFVHAVDERHGVLISSLWDSYWAPRFVGASRALA